jgi:hypothetical protein
MKVSVFRSLAGGPLPNPRCSPASYLRWFQGLQHADAVHPLWLLRPRRERPRRRAAEQRDELAPFQLIELHYIPASEGRRQNIELTIVSQPTF